MSNVTASAAREPFRTLAAVATLAAIIAAWSWWSIIYARGPQGFSMLWVASGVLCGVLLTEPRERWPALVAAAFGASLAVNFLLHGISALGIALSVANTLDAWLVAWWVSRRVPDPSDLSKIRRSVAIATLSALVACSLSAAIAATSRRLTADSPTSFWPMFAVWLASHALGIAIFATLTITALIEGRRMLGLPGRRLELALTLALIAALAWVVFFRSTIALPYLLFLPLLFCVFRHHFGGFVWATAIIAVIATTGTGIGLGPFQFIADASAEQRTVMLQLFLASTCLIGFPMAAILTERRVLAHRVAESERNYRLLADNSSDLIGRIAADGRRLYISPSIHQILGWTTEEFSKPRWDLVHPDDRDSARRAFDGVLRSGEDATVLCRMLHKDGHYCWIEFRYRRVEGGRAGNSPELVYSGRDVTARVEAERTLDRLARYDALTGLPNRLHFSERIELAIARQQRHGHPLALLYLDVDHFKQINDRLGHAAGDDVLREFARRLAACVRATDLAARLGGDEFVVLVEDLESLDAPQAIASKLVAAMVEPIVAAGAPVAVTTSIGIGLCKDIVANVDELMHRADQALYAAKAAGRNTWRLA